jgi:tRNA(Glu) U13 pseudouridine synthase TruD
MFVHAYQSYVWNQVASARVRMGVYGVLAGDLVAVTQHAQACTLSARLSESAQSGDAVQSADDGDAEMSTTDVKDKGKEEGEDHTTACVESEKEEHREKADTEEKVAENVKVVQAGDEHLYSVHDVVLPTPGRWLLDDCWVVSC